MRMEVYFSLTSEKSSSPCDDVSKYRDRLSEDAPRLFSSDSGSFKLLRVGRDHEALQCLTIKDSGLVENELMDRNHNVTDSIFVIFQRHSWGRFLITRDGFLRILIANKIFLPFLDFVHAFGTKFSDDAKMWHTYRERVSRNHEHETKQGVFEFCYNLGYFEKNGRGSGDPWSLRQTCIYQKVDLTDSKSTWVILQPSQDIYRRLKESLSTPVQNGNDLKKTYLRLHLILLSAMLWTWREYVEGLREAADDLGEKAFFSRVELDRKHDYSLPFSDCQRLHLLRKKLLKALSVLDSWSEVIVELELHGSKLEKDEIQPLTYAVSAELGRVRTEVKYHKRNIARIMQDISGTEVLLSKILEFRNNDHIQRLNQGAHDSLNILKGIAMQGQAENKYLAHAAQRAQQDSSSLKALSFVASVFIPGTFIATIFSSQFVQLERNPDGSTDLVAVPQMWIYVVLTIVTTALTFGCIFLLQTKWQSTTPRSEVL